MHQGSIYLLNTAKTELIHVSILFIYFVPRCVQGPEAATSIPHQRDQQSFLQEYKYIKQKSRGYKQHLMHFFFFFIVTFLQLPTSNSALQAFR